MDFPQISLGDVALKVAKILLIAWVIGLALIYANQRRMLYLPDPTRVSPQQARLTGVTEEVLPTPDGEQLIAWWASPKPGKPVILYFHGNGGNLAGRAGRMGAGAQILSAGGPTAGDRGGRCGSGHRRP